jgi:hypothetical protein
MTSIWLFLKVGCQNSKNITIPSVCELLSFLIKTVKPMPARLGNGKKKTKKGKREKETKSQHTLENDREEVRVREREKKTNHPPHPTPTYDIVNGKG